ncbi:hypothetical protein K438DRAFT_2003963 [Mycena galopus ATCC 62051]|nr:hypothetical protein K438DRAFT_2003963 [Mycena galopus ATCC 62051]
MADTSVTVSQLGNHLSHLEISNQNEELQLAYRRCRDVERNCQDNIDQYAAACARTFDACVLEQADYWREHYRANFETVMGQLTAHQRSLQEARTQILNHQRNERALQLQCEVAVEEVAHDLDRALEAESALVALNKRHHAENVINNVQIKTLMALVLLSICINLYLVVA